MAMLRGLYCLCDLTLSPEKTHRDLAESYLRGGAPILQLRMKGEKNLQRVRQVVVELLALKSRYHFTFILNDFVELASEFQEIDGVHLGQDDMNLKQARQILGPQKLLGYSSHSSEEALQAEAEGADYVALGAIFPTKTKGPGHPVVGLTTLSQVVKNARVPVVAIGGIQRHNFAEVVATGVSAVAMIGALSQAQDMEAEARWFQQNFLRLQPNTEP